MAFSTNGGGWGAGWGQSGGMGGQSKYPNVKIPTSSAGWGQASRPNASILPSRGVYGMSGAGWGQAIQDYDRYNQSIENQGAMFDQGINERNMALEAQYRQQELQMQLQSQQQNQWMQMYSQGMSMPTAEQIERSRGDLGQSLQDFGNLRDNGRYNSQEMNTLSQDAWNSINNSATNQAKGMNTQMQSMGLGSNAGGSAALGMAGKFAANAARGGVQANLLQQNKEAQERGMQGYAGISGQMADYASRPVNTMAGFDPWGMLPGAQNPEDEKKKKQAQGLPYGNPNMPMPQAGGNY